VELGFGLSVVPALSVEREARAGTLKAIPLTGLPGRQVALALPGGSLSAAASAFAQLARALLSGGRGGARGDG
jgi:DNA-binding transcriptional LysR family regulator